MTDVDVKQTDIVVTTIFEPNWLEGYLDNIRKHGHIDRVTLRIICDKKTPKSVYEAAEAARAAGFSVDCPDLTEQTVYLQSLAVADGYIPWNSDNRRNIGFLRAFESGADTIISIDDDNYCLDDSDFVASHNVVGAASRTAEIAADASWFNICAMLNNEGSGEIYPRGFPYAARNASSQAQVREANATELSLPVMINAGLWLNDPDVDAITRIAQKPQISSAKMDNVILAPTTWSPINTQNTALARPAMSAYYYVRMGFPLGGMSIDRFGDILSGFFVQKCAKHLGHAVRLGGPVAAHRRSPHNLFKDLYHELAGIVLIEELLPWLQDIELQGSSYSQAYASLADALQHDADRFRGFVWDDGGRDFLRETAANMQQWLVLLQRFGS